jgi:CHAD domain-containing protein
VLPAAVRRSYRCTADRMRQARRAPAGTPADVALHEARKAAKRARYAGEAAAADTENPSSAGIIEFCTALAIADYRVLLAWFRAASACR